MQDLKFGRSRRAFTLVELLIVLGVLAVLGVTALLILNPVENLRQSRDARRLTELDSMSQSLYLFEVDRPDLPTGSTSTVYVSIPDSSSACANLGLPSLPSGWSYACVPSSTLQAVDGAGWIPVDLTAMTYSAPVSVWAVDPVNSTTTGLYYTYVTGGSFKVSAIMESEKYAGVMRTDDGTDAVVYERGNDPQLGNVARGLAGYWSLDGNLADLSGLSAAGTSVGGVGYASGKIASALNLDGSNDYVTTLADDSVDFGLEEFTVAAWIKPVSANRRMLGHWNSRGWGLYVSSAGKLQVFAYGSGDTLNSAFSSSPTLTDGSWHHVACVFRRTGNAMNIDGYVDGSYVGTISDSNVGNITASQNFQIGTYGSLGNALFSGSIDEVRIYGHSMTADEVERIYESTK